MSFTQNVIAAIQSRYAELGYYRLRVDGEPGPGTSAATVAFKRAHGLAARDLIGPLTLARLFSPDAKPAPEPEPKGSEPAWLTEARSLLDVRETPGAGNTPAIMNWARDLDQWFPNDATAWCGLFVAHCMSAGAPNEPQDFNRLGARAWLGYGEPCGPELGAICVLWRTHPTKSWNGHVFIVTGQAPGAIRGIGGNQGDRVSETWFDDARVLGFRKPSDATLTPAPAAKRGVLSANEA